MISRKDYIGAWAKASNLTPAVDNNINRLLNACNKLEALALQDGVKFPVNIKTKSNISGEMYGGFRPLGSGVGAGDSSSHCTGEGVDRFDPDGKIDEWCLKNPEKLKLCGIYIEHPSVTKGWSHWTIRAPKSGNRYFYP